MTSRQPPKKRKIEEKEDITNLYFGADFEDAEAMLNAEVKVIIDSINEEKDLDMSDWSELMQNTTSYVSTFGRFQDKTSIATCKQELVELGCHTFEAACFGNLQPANADEAKRLIPSLTRFTDDAVEMMCQCVQRVKDVHDN
uniref:RNA polymerase Rpb4/RPC9 core domain-containing protein n=1 Tax=Hanusia phi TaxID=3032 RepID=A0A7S0EA73_9CRYP|mmetsp:Transcript_20215/g.45986  ORF Transcript_20215/g.45986 Transcript_20215/m.45986 type:complete len:142 (+) Transcript_20215:124-549(+)